MSDNKNREYEIHGDHWGAVIKYDDDLMEVAIPKALEDSSIVGSVETECTLNSKEVRTCHMLSYCEEIPFYQNSPLTIRTILADKGDELLFVSAYPCATSGSYVSVTVDEINEWENGLEATIEGSLNNGSAISFFDTDYLLHKDFYKPGETYWFQLGAIGYDVEVLEKGAADFEFTGQDAINFKTRLGEEPEYDEEGNVKPVHFSMDKTVMCMPRDCPADNEFQSPLDGSKKVVKFFGQKIVYGYSIGIGYDNEADESITVPLIVAQENLKGKPRAGKPTRGIIWLHGHYVENEQVEKFKYFKAELLAHLDSLL